MRPESSQVLFDTGGEVIWKAPSRRMGSFRGDPGGRKPNSRDCAIRLALHLNGKRKTMANKRKNPAAVSLGRRGGKARLTKLTPERRSEIARKAAAGRWGKKGTGE